MTDLQRTKQLPLGLFVMTVLYGGMTVIAGVLGFKQVALGHWLSKRGFSPF